MAPIFKLVFIIGTLKFSFIVNWAHNHLKGRCDLGRICTLHFAMNFEIKHFKFV